MPWRCPTSRRDRNLNVTSAECFCSMWSSPDLHRLSPPLTQLGPRVRNSRRRRTICGAWCHAGFGLGPSDTYKSSICSVFVSVQQGCRRQNQKPAFAMLKWLLPDHSIQAHKVSCLVFKAGTGVLRSVAHVILSRLLIAAISDIVSQLDSPGCQ